MLEARNLTKRFRATTVKMFAGLLHPSEGQILYKGRNVRDDVIGFRRCLGYVPEEPNLYGYLTGLEYLQFAGGLRGLSDDRVNRKANQLLELLNLQDARWVPVSAYSKGMKQRVLIAAALLHDPDLLIFDEAQSGLDISNALLFRYLLRALAARGKAILYISHVLELVEKTCEHIVVIHQGRIVADDSVATLRDRLQQPGLEGIFAQLIQQEDMESRARDIAAVLTP